MDSNSRWTRGAFGGYVAALAVVAGLVLSLVLSPMVSSAKDNVLTIPAGGTATLSIRGFCMDFGKPFPTQDTAVKGLADDKIRAALNYSIQKGYTEGNPQQVEQAIWF